MRHFLGFPKMPDEPKKRPTLEGLDSLLRRERDLAAAVDPPDLGPAGRDPDPDPSLQLEKAAGVRRPRVPLGWTTPSVVVPHRAWRLQPPPRARRPQGAGPRRRRPARDPHLGPAAGAQEYAGPRLA